MMEPINPGKESVECVQYLANFFVEKSRQNLHKWKPVVYDLIHHYDPVYTADKDPKHVQTYFFQFLNPLQVNFQQVFVEGVNYWSKLFGRGVLAREVKN